MEEMNAGLTALLEGCLQDEYVPRRCRGCGEAFEFGTEGNEPFCPDCKFEIVSA